MKNCCEGGSCKVDFDKAAPKKEEAAAEKCCAPKKEAPASKGCCCG